MSRETKKKLSTLKSQDTTSLLLYMLYKLQQVPEYATLCEIPYIFDQRTSDKLFEFYGGKTVKFPTKEEFMFLIEAMWMYQEIEINRHNPITIFAQVSEKYPNDASTITGMYVKMKELLENDQFAKQFISAD